jgi:hypothetical protein
MGNGNMGKKEVKDMEAYYFEFNKVWLRGPSKRML